MTTLDLYTKIIFPFGTTKQIIKVMFYHLLFFNAHLAYKKVMWDKPSPVSNIYQDCILILDDMDFSSKQDKQD